MAKKIILLDDINERRKELKLRLSRQYADCLEIHAEITEEFFAVEPASDIAYFLLHDSFVGQPGTNPVELIRAFSMQYSIPIAVFSGGFESHIIDSREFRLSSTTLYDHLPDFLRDFTDNKIPQREILLFGSKWKESSDFSQRQVIAIRRLTNTRNRIADVYLIEDELSRKLQLARQIGVEPIKTGSEFSERNLHSIAARLSEINAARALVIPCSLGNVHTNYSGLKLGLHIRLTRMLNHVRFIPIIFVSEDDPIQITKHAIPNLLPLTCSKNCMLVKYSDLQNINALLSNFSQILSIDEEETILRQNLLTRIAIQAPSQIGNHSITNKWGALRLGECLGVKVSETESLFLKYKVASTKYYSNVSDKINPIRDRWNKYFSGKAPKKILIIENDLVWKNVLSELFKPVVKQESNFKFVRTLEEGLETFQKDIYQLVLIDLRLTKEDDEISSGNKIDFFSGAQLVQEIRRLTPATPIIIFTAAHKAWVSEQLKDIGVDGFFYKEPPEYSNEKSFSFHNYTHFLSTIITCLERGEELEWFWHLSERVKGALPSQVVNSNIRNRITEKINMAFFLLRIVQTKYEAQFVYSDYELAFLTYWSIFNEIVADNYAVEDRKNWQIISNGKKFLDNGKSEIRTNRPGKLDYIENTPFYYPVYEEFRSVKGRYDESLPAQIAGLIYLKSSLSEDRKRIWVESVHTVAKHRNQLDFTHSDFSLMRTQGKTIRSVRNMGLERIKENSKLMLKLIYVLILDQEP